MRRTVANLLLLSALAIATVDVPASRADAGLVPDIWNAVFGPPGTPYFAPRAYSAGYYPGYSTYYYPGYSYYGSGFYRQRVFYSPCCPTLCNPCATISPCRVSSVSSGKLIPTKEENGLPKTFKKEDGKDPMSKDDSKFKSRDDGKKFEPTRKEKRETFKGPDKVVPESFIKKRKPTPAKAPIGDPATPAKKLNTKQSPQGPQIHRLNLDEKITRRAAIKRTRLTIRPHIATQTVARTKTNPNTRWKPVARGTQVAQAGSRR